jgi:hypothetical protein
MILYRLTVYSGTVLVQSKFVASEKKLFLHIPYGFYANHYPAVEAIFNLHMKKTL